VIAFEIRGELKNRLTEGSSESRKIVRSLKSAQAAIGTRPSAGDDAAISFCIGLGIARPHL
jgi:hypothetical protein